MKALLIFILHHYKRWISPMFAPHCRFHPSCSSYAIEALNQHGTLRGGLLALRRVLRCNPFCHGGIDPVPECDAHGGPTT